MILSDKSIHQYLKEGKLKIQPIDDYQIQPASVDLILDKKFLQVSEEGQLLNLIAPAQYEAEKEKISCSKTIWQILLPASKKLYGEIICIVKLQSNLPAKSRVYPACILNKKSHPTNRASSFHKSS